MYVYMMAVEVCGCSHRIVHTLHVQVCTCVWCGELEYCLLCIVCVCVCVCVCMCVYLLCVHVYIQLTIVHALCMYNARYSTLHHVTDQTVCAVF